MSDIKQAAKWMQEGKRVHHKGSLAVAFINENEVVKAIIVVHPVIQEHCYVFTCADLLADDWEIAE
jgi:hypothetical protein